MKGEPAKLLTDEYAAKILMATYGREMDALTLSRELEIPIAACYRRIHSLEDAGLLECTGERTGIQGKKIKVYRSLLRRAKIEFKNGRLVAEMEMTDGRKMEAPLALPS